MSVHAHPDDESSKGAATVASLVSRGAQALIVTCTGGERGSVLNPALRDRFWARRDMGGLRRAEMRRSLRHTGADHVWLGYVDSGLPEDGDPVPSGSFADLPLDQEAWPLVRAIRRFRPHVLVTYDERGGYPHPDHIRTHEVSMRAIDLAADEDAGPELGAPWNVSKIYYDRMHTYDRMRAIADAAAAAGVGPGIDSAWIEAMRERPLRVTTKVPVGEFFETRDLALRAHESQVAPDSPFFFWPNDLLRSVWPTEDYELVRSTVPPAADDAIEIDLFDGVDDDGWTAPTFDVRGKATRQAQAVGHEAAR